jgi:TRAP-type C4-dicarboxylate transport system substrate-binding protein
VPFGSGDIIQVSKILVDLYDKIPFLKGQFEKEYNQKVLGIATGNSFDLITTFPWTKVSELAGHKIGGGGVNLPWIKAISGVVPVQMNYNEAYTSLQTGVYEGVLGGPDGALGFRLYETAKTYTICGLGCNVMGLIVINLDTWKKLPPEVQAIMLEVGREYAKVVAEASLAKKNLALGTMRKAGTQINTLSFEQQQKWAKMMPDLPNEKAKEAEQKGMPGKEVISGYIKALDAQKYKFPRRWVVR